MNKENTENTELLRSIKEQLDRIERQQAMKKDILTTAEAADLLNLNPQYLYRLTCAHKIPFYKNPNGKKLFFERVELLQWMRSGRSASDSELEQRAADFDIQPKRKTRKTRKIVKI